MSQSIKLSIKLKYIVTTFLKIIFALFVLFALLSGSLVVVLYATYGRVCNDSSVPVWVSTSTDFSRAPDRWRTFPLEPGECTSRFRDGEGIWTYRTHTPQQGDIFAQCELLILKVGSSTLHFEDGTATDDGTHPLRITSDQDQLSWVTAASRVEGWLLSYSGLSLTDLEADINYYVQTDAESENCSEAG